MGYRAIQWATGAMGRASLRTMIDHPNVDVVGVYVYSPSKVGRDAGELVRRPALGVAATDVVEDILALEADVVVHSGMIGPYGSHDADLIRLLRAGKNVITINGYSRPRYWVGARLDALQAACMAGNSSLLSAGLNPGFVGEQLAVTASGLCSELEHLEITEYLDSSEVRSPEYLFGTLGFGADPAAVDPNDPTWAPARALNGMYTEALAAIGYRLGMTLDAVEPAHRVHPATQDVRLPAGVVRRGTVSHTNWRWNGVVGGRPTLTMSIHWFVETAHLELPDPPLWRVSVEGQPRVRVSVELDKNPRDRSRMTAEQYALAGSVVNSIPLVVRAPAGVMTRPMAAPFRADYAGATS